jgi:hypothetical protein
VKDVSKNRACTRINEYVLNRDPYPIICKIVLGESSSELRKALWKDKFGPGQLTERFDHLPLNAVFEMNRGTCTLRIVSALKIGYPTANVGSIELFAWWLSGFL